MVDAETRAAMVEAGAQVIYDHYQCDRLDCAQFPDCQKDGKCERAEIVFEAAITAAILAAEERGFKLVGPDATEEMLKASGDEEWKYQAGNYGQGLPHEDVWLHQHDAAPKWGEV